MTELTRPRQDDSGDKAFLAIALIVVATLWFSRLLILGGPSFGIDDAYIYGHNAEVLLRGSDPNYGVSALYGTTSAPFLLILSVFRAAFPLLWALELACLVGALLYAAAVWRLGRQLPIGWRALALLTALCAARTLHHVTNGLETGLAMAAVAWAIVGVVERSRWLGLLMGLLPAVRPDLLPLAFFIWLTGPDRARHLILATLTFAPFALWYLIETGAPFPLTGEAKQIYFAETSWPLSQKLSVAGTGLGLWLLEMSPVAVGFLLLPRRVALCLVGSAIIVLGIGLWTLPSSFYMYDGRYFYPFAPFAVAGVVLSGRRILIAVGAAVGMLLTPIWWHQHIETRDYAKEHLAPLAEWLNHNLPPRSKLLIHDAGYVSVFTHFRMTDVVGLKSPAAMSVHREYAARGDRARAIAEIARGHDYLVVLGGWESRINSALLANGWTLQRTGPNNIFHVYKLTSPARDGHPTAATQGP